jgi:3-oxoacyl-[acyl-carrier protein] reductase
MNIQNSTFIVTGGSSGIGKATARKLRQEGAEVLITGRDGEKVERVAMEIGAIGVQADVSTPEGIALTMDTAKEAFGYLHGLINNAGHGWVRKVGDYNWRDFEEIYRVNVFGAAMMGQAVAELFIQQHYGNIVNIASTAALKGYAGGGIYSSSKFALRGLTQCWQAELRPHNIRVFGVNPSEVTTAFAQQGRIERAEVANKLRAEEIAHAIVEALKMDDRGFIPELTIHATNPF